MHKHPLEGHQHVLARSSSHAVSAWCAAILAQLFSGLQRLCLAHHCTSTHQPLNTHLNTLVLGPLQSLLTTHTNPGICWQRNPRMAWTLLHCPSGSQTRRTPSYSKADESVLLYTRHLTEANAKHSLQQARNAYRQKTHTRYTHRWGDPVPAEHATIPAPQHIGSPCCRHKKAPGPQVNQDTGSLKRPTHSCCCYSHAA